MSLRGPRSAAWLKIVAWLRIVARRAPETRRYLAAAAALACPDLPWPSPLLVSLARHRLCVLHAGSLLVPAHPAGVGDHYGRRLTGVPAHD